ncbi:MAG: hypothetical protein JW733_05990 [Coriobacteriia bacterium]|nr:hypothetical protein [Coriobacteriia bacterium]MBN2839553.1 hypothetical protein [Coriobacteriia bacterium]
MHAPVRVLLRRILRITITLAVIGVVGNDALKVVPAFMAAGDAINAAMTAAMTAAGATPDVPDSGRQAAIDGAAAFGATVESYSQQSGETPSSRVVQLAIEVSVPVQGTVLAAPILGLIDGAPSSTWYSPSGVKVSVAETKRVNVY